VKDPTGASECADVPRRSSQPTVRPVLRASVNAPANAARVRTKAAELPLKYTS